MDKNYFEILYSHLNFITETKKKQFSMENMKLSSIPLFSMHGGPLPPFIVTWDSEIFGPYFNVVVDAIGPETDFTLETNVKE